jgi:hypothetical protein
MTPSWLVNNYGRFRGVCSLYLKGPKSPVDVASHPRRLSISQHCCENISALQGASFCRVVVASYKWSLPTVAVSYSACPCTWFWGWGVLSHYSHERELAVGCMTKLRVITVVQFCSDSLQTFFLISSCYWGSMSQDQYSLSLRTNYSCLVATHIKYAWRFTSTPIVSISVLLSVVDIFPVNFYSDKL